MIFPENVGPQLSIDEVSLSQGELYTFVSNKEGKAKKNTLVASIKGTKASDIINVLERLPLESRKKVTEITLDMAKNRQAAVTPCFPNACLVTDRFHVVKLVIDALQHLRIKYRWEVTDQENEAIALARKQGKTYSPKVYDNGDTPKKLLTRSRFMLAKDASKWTEHQRRRAEILFREYPEIERGYTHVMELRNIYSCTTKSVAKQKMEQWISKTNKLDRKELNTASRSIEYHLEHILNFFDHRNTNAFAESFNAKIKLFRANCRGVKDTSFFLFRIATLFA